MLIVGAGLAGLLAAHRLREHDPIVIERQDAVPNNHQALLRFRSDRLQTQFGIPLKKVRVTKGVLRPDGKMANEATLLDNNAYSLKVTGALSQRSIGSMEPVDRWIAPSDLTLRLAKGLRIQFGINASDEMFKNKTPIISTMPMPALMGMTKWGDASPSFKYSQINVVRARLPGCDLNQTLYCPHENTPYYRASIVGDQLIIETKTNVVEPVLMAQDAAHLLLGTTSVVPEDVQLSTQKLGKIIDVDPIVGREFIVFATDQFNTYSVGRFALWRNIVTDDVLDDLEAVARMIASRSSYQRRLHSAR